MSPRISADPLADPSQEDGVFGRAGTTSATGRPNLVTLMGAPVRRTSSRTAKHVALNLEIAISRIFELYHSPIPWSKSHPVLEETNMNGRLFCERGPDVPGERPRW
jgi:hypothetical protein